MWRARYPVRSLPPLYSADARPTAVYRIPPLKANEGHRAQEWGDLAQPLWKGRMRIVEKSDTVSLVFEDAQTGMDSPTHSMLLIESRPVQVNVCIGRFVRDLFPEISVPSIRKGVV